MARLTLLRRHGSLARKQFRALVAVVLQQNRYECVARRRRRRKFDQRVNKITKVLARLQERRANERRTTKALRVARELQLIGGELHDTNTVEEVIHAGELSETRMARSRLFILDVSLIRLFLHHSCQTHCA